ncbi:MAG TPA: cytochrome c biogenesis protein CcdA [Candidatus Saccharimonadales bacterium]|nr:cytochrome c biogenesis protein CcdA [Candidatus Saccharimonadales bacterium]
MLQLLLLSFLAGTMTVLAPCILPLLPIIIGGSINNGPSRWYKPFVITASLGVSIILFTLLLKFSTALLGVPQQVWQIASGAIILLLGITMTWPKAWEPIGAKLNLRSSKLLGRAGRQKGVLGDVLTGAALGPVFASCSPTFAFIVAAVLPIHFGLGLTYLAAYAAGLVAIFLFIALIGQKLVAKLAWASNPSGWFKRVVGILFIIVGLFVATGFDRHTQAFLVEKGWYDPFAGFEQSLLQK